ncbi:MAG: thiol-disulfide isomerase/thioredoxin [Bacteriovoracaceae bacterium]|jgi:thiol-disulfide isomerase/thioredoxin
MGGNRVKILIFLLTLLPLVSSAEVSFFEDDINFWSEKKENKQVHQPSNKKAKFDWSKYKNIENDEFFKEGNHIPPKPFMEVARRPTEENIKNWLEYIKMKNDLQARFQKALVKYREKVSITPESSKMLIQKSRSLVQTKLPQENITITTYFLTTCPACKRMFKTLEELQRMGVYVEAIQVDSDKKLKFGVSIPIYKINKKEKEGILNSGIGVPYSIVRVGKRAIPVNGFQTVKSLFETLNKLQ